MSEMKHAVRHDNQRWNTLRTSGGGGFDVTGHVMTSWPAIKLATFPSSSVVVRNRPYQWCGWCFDVTGHVMTSWPVAKLATFTSSSTLVRNRTCFLHETEGGQWQNSDNKFPGMLNPRSHWRLNKPWVPHSLQVAPAGPFLRLMWLTV
jgi:hypothetical protein